ncbi:MAG: PAS domain-containing protein, partial [Candidatus Hodarchaeales archaeon]|jgi:DUF438 domain-containing protein
MLSIIEDLIFKEENILFPTSLEKLTNTDWLEVRKGEEEIGYAWVKPGNEWKPITPEIIHKPLKVDSRFDLLELSTGKMTKNHVDLLLTHLPVDITLINDQDEVVYYSDTSERIFPRSSGIIGRKVQNCHPPKSVHIVEKILQAFKSGSKDIADFWIESQGKFIYIRYFALRDENQQYNGTLEVTQDVTEIRQLDGEQRLLSWE